MRVAKALIAVAIVTLVSGCAASAPPPQQAAVVKGSRTSAQGLVIPCTTTSLGVATTASCGSGGFNLFSAAGE